MNQDQRKELDSIKSVINQALKLQTPEDLAAEEEEVIDLATKLTSGIVEENGVTEERVDYIVRCLIEVGALSGNKESETAELKAMFNTGHAVCSKYPCVFCRHKEKLQLLLGDRIFLLPRMAG